jgi:hypothetical protein
MLLIAGEGHLRQRDVSRDLARFYVDRFELQGVPERFQICLNRLELGIRAWALEPADGLLMKTRQLRGGRLTQAAVLTDAIEQDGDVNSGLGSSEFVLLALIERRKIGFDIVRRRTFTLIGRSF